MIPELGQCELSVFDTEEETKAYARKKGIGKLYIVGEDITIVDIGGRKHETHADSADKGQVRKGYGSPL